MTEIISKAIVETYKLKIQLVFFDFLCRTAHNCRKKFLLADPRFAADGYQKMLILLK